jgi:PHD/YefM family antitoxin component YafN of YafNO toxin-antitoxin module
MEEIKMKVGNAMTIDDNILRLVGRLVSVSDFSKGKTAKIFDDIKKNQNEYIVLKNNQPAAVLLSFEGYSEIVAKAKKMEDLLERVEELRLLREAKRVSESYKPQEADSFHEVLSELEISQEEINKLEDSVVIE